MMEQGLKNFTVEVSVFFQFMRNLAEDLGDGFELDYLTLSSALADFYEKNKNKYNESQLVYQFLMQSYKGDKHITKMYNAFRKLKESGEITIPHD